MLLAREIQQAYGVAPQSILTMPILPGIDGVQKMSKSLGNYVGVDDPPEEVYGKLMRVPDEAMPTYYELLLDEPLDPRCRRATPSAPMARALTARYHGEQAAAAAEERFDALHVRHELPDEIEDFAFAANGDAVHLPALLAEAFGVSRSEAQAAARPGRRQARRRAARRRRARSARGAPRRGRAPAWQAAPDAGCAVARPPVGGATLLRRASGRSGDPTPEGARSLKTQQCTRPDAAQVCTRSGRPGSTPPLGRA